MAFQGQRLPAISVSLGVAVFPAHGETGQAVMDAADAADAALYQAKASGRDRVELALGSPTPDEAAA